MTSQKSVSSSQDKISHWCWWQSGHAINTSNTARHHHHQYCTNSSLITEHAATVLIEGFRLISSEGASSIGNWEQHAVVDAVALIWILPTEPLHSLKVFCMENGLPLHRYFCHVYKTAVAGWLAISVQDVLHPAQPGFIIINLNLGKNLIFHYQKQTVCLP